jgi:signal transduction histidine kinase
VSASEAPQNHDFAETIIILHINSSGMPRHIQQKHIQHLKEALSRARPGATIRARTWSLDQIGSLIERFPQIGYKYFSDVDRQQSDYRKTLEELYLENTTLSERLTQAIVELKEEKDKRIRAERDSIWKDISFSSAHKIGNPIFAIETNLDPLTRRIREGRLVEASHVIDQIRLSVERAKSIVDQFKSLTRAQETNPIATLIYPILEDSCWAARGYDICCHIECLSDLQVQGDPDRLAECFEELVANALNWFDKPTKEICICVFAPAPTHLPDNVDSRLRYVLIEFRDNGSGVPVENKTRIFDAFFTTHPHGTGLGLALVRRIVEAHQGTILERGISGEGSCFLIYLPAADQSIDR